MSRAELRGLGLALAVSAGGVLASCGEAGAVLLAETGGASSGGGVGGGGDDGGEPVDGTCGLQSDLTEAELVEGDTVSLTLSCADGLTLDEVELELTAAPYGAELDGFDFEWETDGDDAGPVELLFTAKPRGSTELPETLRVDLWINDDPDAANDEQVDPETYVQEFGLPVLHVDPRGSLSSSYTDAEVWFQGKEYEGNIKIRGASSSYYPKPGYTLEFNDDELDVPGWEPDDRDHLVLVSPFDDNSYVRQKLVYDQWTAMAEYWGETRLTPRTFFVVVYLNGDYQGLFMGLDRIDNEFLRHMGFDDTGNLYKSVTHDANFYIDSAYGGSKGTLADGYEKKEGEPESDFTDLISLVGFTGGSSDKQLIEQAGDWLHLDEFMDWFLLVSYSLSEDSAGKNAYLYHDPSTDLWRYVPWDFNHAWGQNWYTLRIDADQLNSFQSTNRVFKAIQGRPDSDAELWDRFKAMRADGPFHPDWFTAQLDSYYAEIDRSAEKDWDTWEDSYRSYSGWASSRNSYGDWTDYEGEKAYLYEWVEERAEVYAELVPD